MRDPRQDAINRLVRQTNLTQETAAIIVDPHWKPRDRQGLIRVRVLQNMTYLDGKFHNAGEELAVPKDEAAAAVQIGVAAWTEAAPEASDA